MAQTIKRGGKGVRRAAATRTNKARVTAAKRTTGSVLDQAMAALPVSQERLHQAFLAVILGGAAVLAWVVASFAGVPAMATVQIASLAADAGFEVRRVEVRGVERMNELKVYDKVLGERDRAMPLVDLAGLREKLLELSWVGDARVSRQLPDTLVIDIVERVPHAVLKKPGRYVLIDAEGRELEPVKEARAKSMLVVAGPGAGKQVVGLDKLLDAAPALKPQVREAEWIGNRRWNLTFRTGQVLALPEGNKPSAKALVEFARLDGVNRLLGGRVAAFDMRAPDRIYLRLPNRAADAAKPTPAASASAKPAAKPAAKAD
ncbi:cell division protein FtsQ/DivIB [Sphingomonas sp.]|uniref:cell division protein FtsQ/DivIB n=1 Tax=Sphingomonas sp. TaxID=28214 RepID=UPI00286E5E96|nr:cell division protein FtsQ/DivIB [Sphingomonas sp.]